MISGEGFGTTVEENMVSINGKQATVKVVTATTLTIIAPENPSGTYPVKVTVADKTVENLSFTYEDLSYTVATVAGNSATTSTDGKGTAASFKFPQGLALAPNGDIWIAERGNNVIRKWIRNIMFQLLPKVAPLHLMLPGKVVSISRAYIM